jgi:hypothetical protein
MMAWQPITRDWRQNSKDFGSSTSSNSCNNRLVLFGQLSHLLLINVISCIVHTHKALSLQGVSPKFDEKFTISQEVSGF